MASDQRTLNFLSYYESLIYEESEAAKYNASPSAKAHIQRKIMAQIHFSVNSSQTLVSLIPTSRPIEKVTN